MRTGTGEILPSRHFDNIVDLLATKRKTQEFFDSQKVITSNNSYQDDIHRLVEMYKEEYPDEVEDLEYVTLRNRITMVLRVCTWEGGFLARSTKGYRTTRPIDIELDRRKCINSYRVEKRRGCSGGYEIPEHEQKFVSTFYKDRQEYLRNKYPYKGEIRNQQEQTEDNQMDFKKDQPEQLKELGSADTKYNYEDPSPDILETFPNQFPHRDYVTEFVFYEFSSLCPKTGQPDFAVVKVEYIPNKLCIETKSLKLYFLSYRQHGSFMETITNNILEHCVTVCQPRWMRITANFNRRGGTDINVVAETSKKEDNETN